MTLASPIDVVIESRSDDRGDILRLDLVAADGGDLPAFTAGAHVEIAVPLAEHAPDMLSAREVEVLRLVARGTPGAAEQPCGKRGAGALDAEHHVA